MSVRLDPEVCASTADERIDAEAPASDTDAPMRVGTADAFTLFERFEAKLEKHQGNLLRASVELAKDWRTDRMLRRLEAMLLVADRESTLIITGNGDVLEPEKGVGAIGSGGSYAQAAALALFENTDLAPAEVVRKSLGIAGELCIYTNLSLTIETLD